MRGPDERFRVTPDVLTAGAIADLVADPACGAVATFVGLVRDQNAGRRVLWLDYEAYAPLALKAFRQIEEEARRPLALRRARHPPPDGPGGDR